MSPIGEWVVSVVGEHPARPWLVVVVGPEIETACNPGA